jgi:DNA-binding Lrp family transcriptional regulator
MKNSRRSDRELSKIIKVSQPTITRLRAKLEREGVIKEYTMIPDFAKLGYQIMGVTLLRRSEAQNEEKTAETRKAMAEAEKQSPHAYLMVVTGEGLGKNRLFISFYEDYSDYARVMNLTKTVPNFEVQKMESFLVDLNDGSNYRPLSMAAVAHHVSIKKGEKRSKKERRIRVLETAERKPRK